MPRLLIPRRVVFPRGEIPPLRKRRPIADGGHEGRGRQRSNAGHLCEPYARRISPGDGLDLLIGVVNGAVQQAPLVTELLP